MFSPFFQPGRAGNCPTIRLLSASLIDFLLFGKRMASIIRNLHYSLSLLKPLQFNPSHTKLFETNTIQKPHRNHKLQGAKIIFCAIIALFPYFFFKKRNFKVDGSARFLGGTSGKIRLSVKNGYFPWA